MGNYMNREVEQPNAAGGHDNYGEPAPAPEGPREEEVLPLQMRTRGWTHT